MPNGKYGGGSLRKEGYLEILKQNKPESVKKLKSDCKWVFQQQNDPQHNSKQNGNKYSNVKILA